MDFWYLQPFCDGHGQPAIVPPFGDNRSSFSIVVNGAFADVLYFGLAFG